LNKFPILIFLAISVSSFIIPYQVVSAASPGDIIVVDVGVVPPTIFNQNPAGGNPTIIHQGSPYITPFGVTVEPSTGDLIVADRGAVAIFRQNPDGGAPTIIHQGFPYFAPNGVTIDQATGDIIVADLGAHAIFRQNPAGGMPTVIHSGNPYLGGPVDVAFEPSTGDVIVAHSDGSIIFRQDLAGGFPSIVCAGTVFDNPESVVVEPSTGDIIVAVFGAAPEATTIYRLNPFAMCDVPSPVDPQRIPPPGEQYHGPHGVALEPSTGDIIVVDAILDTVFRQNPSGGNPTIIHSGSPYSFPADVTVIPELTPVPVPDVVGLDQASATAAIEGAGLTVGIITFENNNIVPAGNVISQSIGFDEMVPPGTPVNLVISLGPEDDGNGQVVGGDFLPIETTSLLLASAQSFSWMIPVVLSVIGIGLFVVSRRFENS